MGGRIQRKSEHCMVLEVTQSTIHIKSFWLKAVSGIAGATVEDETLSRSSDNMFHV